MEHVFMVKNTSEKGKSFKPQSVENNIELALNLMKTLVSWPMLECICFSCSYICVSSSAVFELCALKYLISLLTPEALWRVQSVNRLPDSLIHKHLYWLIWHCTDIHKWFVHKYIICWSWFCPEDWENEQTFLGKNEVWKELLKLYWS